MSAGRLVPLILLAAVALPQKKPVTLEVASSAGRPTGPGQVLWAPDGKSLLWQQGSRIVLYDVAARSQRELVDTKAMEEAALPPPEPEAFEWVNRRVREQRIQWSSQGDELLIQIRGDLFLYTLSTGKWRQLTKTREAERDAKLSPDGRKVSFRRDRNLCVIDTTSGKLTQLTHDGSATRWNAELDWVYPEELDLGTAHWWSPDSRRIAYLQFDVSPVMFYPHGDLLKVNPVAEPQRYPQAGTPNSNVRLGIVPSSGGKTRWLELGEPEDGLIARVDWLPDGSAIAVRRLTRIQDKLRLLLIDPSSGKLRTVLKESASAWINLRDDAQWLKSSRQLIWGSERDGWRHLYLYDRDGTQLSRITQGEWEVTDLACVDEPGRRVYYLSTEASPLERHLYSIGFDGSGQRRLTAQPGSHSVTMSPDCSHYVGSHSSLTEPAARTLNSADGAEIAVLRERDRKPLEEYEILPTELVQFRAGGVLFHARLIKPAGFRQSARYPAIVMVYGGPHAQSVRNSWRGADWDQALAHQGFVIWQMDNRGSAGRGHLWEAPLHRRFGARELADQLEGVKHLVSLGFVDEARIGIYGWSYGGYMTLYSLFNAPDTFRAGVAGAPVTDWRNYDTIYTERYLGLPSENEEGYKLSSPVHQAAKLKAQLMLVHNFEDDNVLFQHTLRMMDALQQAGKHFEFLLYPQKSHAVSGPARKHMLEAITGFFERHLK